MRPRIQDNRHMRSATMHPTPTDTPEVIALRGQVAQLKLQLEWFKRQLFGRKSERFAPQPDPQQRHLGQLLDEELSTSPEQDAASHQSGEWSNLNRRRYPVRSASCCRIDGRLRQHDSGMLTECQ